MIYLDWISFAENLFIEYPKNLFIIYNILFDISNIMLDIINIKYYLRTTSKNESRCK